MSMPDDLHSLYFDLERAAGAIKHVDREMLDLAEIRRVIRLAQYFIETVQPLLGTATLQVEVNKHPEGQDGAGVSASEWWKVSVAARLSASQLAAPGSNPCTDCPTEAQLSVWNNHPHPHPGTTSTETSSFSSSGRRLQQRSPAHELPVGRRGLLL